MKINRKSPVFTQPLFAQPFEMPAKKTAKATPSKKKQVVERLYQQCVQKNDFTFSNDEVKAVCQVVGFKNPFDATKLDNTDIIPDILKEKNLFISHLGEGMHCFVPGIEIGYHAFEEIAEKKPWLYKKSLLNEFDDSESNILSVAFNQGIIDDFLHPHDRRANPNFYGAKRTKCTFSYHVGKTKLQMTKLQMEIDMTMEHNNEVTIFEGKNNFPEQFAVYQIYHPFLYYHTLKNEEQLSIEKINCCYLLRKKLKAGSIIRVYLYTFTAPYKMDSIKLVKSTEYLLSQSNDGLNESNNHD